MRRDKGNTHTHTLESDGDSTPDEVTRWYKERGYQFLVLSDHNVLTPIAELARAHAVPEQFLLVPGEEVTDAFAKKPLHINGLNVERLVEPQHGGSVTETVQRNVDAIRAARGVPHINHPNYGWAIAPAELAALERYRLLEIYNGHPMVNNLGGGDRPGIEEVWDRLLGAGRRVYGIAVDDAHYFKRPWDAMAPRPAAAGWSYTPRGSRPAALLASLEAGDFYASTGVELDGLQRRPHRHRPSGQAGRRHPLPDPPDLRRRDRRDHRRSGRPLRLAARRGYARVVVTDSNGGKAWGQPSFLTSGWRARD